MSDPIQKAPKQTGFWMIVASSVVLLILILSEMLSNGDRDYLVVQLQDAQMPERAIRAITNMFDHERLNTLRAVLASALLTNLFWLIFLKINKKHDSSV
jgi:hypothetical protein